MSGKKKGGLSQFLYGTIKGKTIVNYMMSLGASVVIVGALFKIQHYPGASAMLVIGLLTEAFLFAIGAIEPQHMPYEWEKIYPQLAHHEEDEHGEEHSDEMDVIEEGNSAESNLPITQQLDNLLEDAKIGPELIQSLSAGLTNLKDSTERLSDITDASVASNEYADSLKSASMNVSNLSDSYVRASESLNSVASGAGSASAFGTEMEKVSKNLADLNSVYELQLKAATEQVESSSKYFEGVDELLKSLSDSVSDAKSYKQNIGQLSENIAALNTVYGNMLSAMKS